jgi:hypothetical protein
VVTDLHLTNAVGAPVFAADLTNGQTCNDDGIVVADGDHVEGNLPVRPPSAGVAAVQQIALTTWDWATLLTRVWGFDALTCTGCGGRMRFIAVIKDRAVIERILKHLGEDAEVPKFARARDPCDLWA